MPLKLVWSAPASSIVRGREWLGEALAHSTVRVNGPKALLARVAEEEALAQIGILHASVEMLGQARTRRGADSGDVALRLAPLVDELYGKRLPLHEEDIVDLLRATRAGCGHGDDFAPPLELAIRYARKEGLSPSLAAAVRAYADALRGIGSSKAQTAKRKSAFLLVLADDGAGSGATPLPWAHRFRAALEALPARERASWQRFVLHMPLNDVARIPAPWRKKCQAFVRDVGALRVIETLTVCWPTSADSRAKLRVETACTHLLKNLIWVLSEVATVDERADLLVAALAEQVYDPRERAEKVVVAAALHFEARPSPVATESLRKLSAWVAASKQSGPSARLVAEALAAIEAIS